MFRITMNVVQKSSLFLIQRAFGLFFEEFREPNDRM
jgi:hypothetical protein